MRTELFINIYKNDELYLQRKVSLKDKALFMGSSPEADVSFPLEELAPFQLLVIPPLPEYPKWRILDETTEKLLTLESETQRHEMHPWNFEFKIETGFTPEWEAVQYDPQGDTVVLSFLRDQQTFRRQYMKLEAQLRLQWKGQEITLKRNELRSRTEGLKFENENEQLDISLVKKHQLSFLGSLGKSLQGIAAASVLVIALGVATTFSTKSNEIVSTENIEKVMVVKIPASTPHKPAEEARGNAPQETQQQQAQQGGGQGSSRSIASLGKAFRRFSKGLQGVALAPSQLAGGFQAGNLGAKLEGMNSASGGSGSGNKLFNGAAVGSTMGRGLAGVHGIRLLEDEVESSGGLKKEIIAQYIKSYLGQIVQCFERELSIQPDLTGKVVVNFTINGHGQVSQALIQKSQFENTRFHGCITQKVHSWTFPVPEGGINVVVNYPFLFRAQ